MATKLRRSLFIGLGGTGLNSILQTKKRIIETYGEVPPMIGFLVIDTDQNAFNKTLKSKLEEHGDIGLDNSEKCILNVPNPMAIYNGQKHLFGWMPEENLTAMTSISFGAGQVRTTGRFASFCNFKELNDTISQKITGICNAQIINNSKYQLANKNVEIHMAFSFAGGTGSGIFIDVAYIIRDLIERNYAALHCKMFGYGILPGVFVEMGGSGAGMARVKPNGYGALKDVDYLMHLKPSSPNFEIDYGDGRIIKTNQRPFDTLMLIDNKDQSGNIYDNVGDLAELVSLSLAMGGSEVSSDLQSVMDNVVVNINGGMMDVENKKAWASGLGVCEIYFDGNKLGNIYAEKVINGLVREGILNTCGDNNNKVNAWIDTLKIRENNGKDDVLDKLLNPVPNVQFLDIDDLINPTPFVDNYLNTNQVKVDKEKISNLVMELLNSTRSELKKFLITESNKDCGVGNVRVILKELKSQSLIFKSEMEEETEIFVNKILTLENQRKSSEIELKELASNKSIFVIGKKSKLDDAKSQLCNIVNEYAKCIREKERREYAKQFFTSVLVEIESYEQPFDDLNAKLKDIAEKSIKQVENIQNNVNEKDKKFIIELQGEYAKSIDIDDIDIKVSQFVSSLGGNGIFDFTGMSNELIRDKFWFYAKNLKGALVWRNKTIDSIIKDLPKERLDEIIKKSIEKSQPLFSYDYQGLVISKQIETSFFVGLPNKEKSLLTEDGYFNSFITGNVKINFTSTGMNDRIIIYRQIASVPAYALIGVKEYEAVYNNMSKNHNFHIDKNLETRMIRGGYDLYPDRGRDNSLELWIKGILLGFIKNDNTKYSIKSGSKGDALDDFWYELGSSEFRDDCFNNFKSNISNFEQELSENLSSKQTQMGKENLDRLLTSISSSNYLSDHSQLGFTLDNLRADKKKYDGVLNLMRDEINFVNTELKN